MAKQQFYNMLNYEREREREREREKFALLFLSFPKLLIFKQSYFKTLF